jgi:hypothetical protein
VKRRRLRRLVPDAELIRRRAAGEPLRELAADYDVSHTTLSRYFDRAEVAKQLRQAVRQLRAAQRAGEARSLAERRLEQEVRRKARGQAALERERARRALAVSGKRAARRRRSRSDYEAWLVERVERRPLARADLHSRSDEIAARVVSEGGGMQAVIDASGLRTLENVLRLIDPAILEGAYDNDLLRQAQPPPT